MNKMISALNDVESLSENDEKQNSNLNDGTESVSSISKSDS
jgi:hypothetical protein